MQSTRTQQFVAAFTKYAGGFVTFTILALAERTGVLSAMTQAGPLTASALAERAGIDQRYCEEILLALTAAEVLDYQPGDETFLLPDEHAAVLVDSASPDHLAGWLDMLPALVSNLDRLVEVVQDGGGIRWDLFDERVVAGMDRSSGPSARAFLVDVWLATMPDVVERLIDGGTVLDIGCGAGNAILNMAERFPKTAFTGIDLDPRAIGRALEKTTVTSPKNVTFDVIDAADLAEREQFDLITTFDVVHDLPDPINVLRSIRDRLAPGGVFLMVEPSAPESPEESVGDLHAATLHGIGLLWCIPQSKAAGGPGLGPMWGETMARRLVQEAGFGSFERLPIEPDHGAFYRIEG